MNEILKFTIFLLVQYAVINNGVQAEETSVEAAFEGNEIVPDVIPKAPKLRLSVTYSKEVEVDLGTVLTVLQTTKQPSVTWEGDAESFYTLIMVDPDVPSKVLPLARSFKHWLIVNIPGSDVKCGRTLASYIPPTPPPATGFHRYVFLLYQQPGNLTFDEGPLNISSNLNRPSFKVPNFANKYNLGDPVAGNFFKEKFLVPDRTK